MNPQPRDYFISIMDSIEKACLSNDLEECKREMKDVVDNRGQDALEGFLRLGMDKNLKFGDKLYYFLDGYYEGSKNK